MFQNIAKLRTAVISVSKTETVTTPPQGYIVFHGKIGNLFRRQTYFMGVNNMRHPGGPIRKLQEGKFPSLIMFFIIDMTIYTLLAALMSRSKLGQIWFRLRVLAV